MGKYSPDGGGLTLPGIDEGAYLRRRMEASRSFPVFSIWCQCSVLVAAVIGCANQEPIGRFTSEPLAPFSEPGLAEAADRWWRELGDPALNARVEQAFGDNYDLAAALQRVAAARAVARRQASDFFPDVNGVIDAQSIFGPGEDQFPSVIGLDASYQVDLWGQIESRVEAEQFRAAATYADYQAVALTVAAEVTRTWLTLTEANAQLSLLDEQIETNRKGLELQESRFELGQVRSPDVLRQRQLLESTFEQYALAESRVEVLEHQLAVLLGELPQSADYDPGTVLPSLPPLPRTGLPAQLLKRRPDVRRDYLAFVAADRDLAAAVSDQFPRLNLTGSVLNVADSPEELFRDWFVSIGSQLIAPLIDGGQRRAEIDRTAAVTRLRFNQYGQTMLIAFREVEDALTRERYQVQRLKHLTAQVELARQSSEQLREQYLIGDEAYLAVLTAITAWQRLQRETLSARLDLRLFRVALYSALAGGTDPRIPSVPAENLTAADDVVPSIDEANADGAAGESPDEPEEVPSGEGELAAEIPSEGPDEAVEAGGVQVGLPEPIRLPLPDEIAPPEAPPP